MSLPEEVKNVVPMPATPCPKRSGSTVLIPDMDYDEEIEELESIIEQLQAIIDIKPRRLYPGAIEKINRLLKHK